MSVLRSVASRLFLSYLIVVGVGLLAAAIAMSGLLLTYEDQVTRLRLEELSAPFLAAVQTGVREGRMPRDIVEGLTEQARAANARLLIVGGGVQRRVLVDSEGALVNQQLPRPTSGAIGQFREGDEQWLYVQQGLRPPAQALLIVVARPKAVFADTLRALSPSLGVGALTAVGAALVVAGLLSRTITQPLRRLVRGARAFASGDYAARVDVGGPSEVAELGGAFNEMAGEVQRARGAEQAFLADISHELRTPLTSIQGFAQAISEGEARGEGVTRAAAVIQRESRRLVRMVEGLLQVARIEAGAPASRQPVALADVLGGAVDALDVQAHEAGVRFDVALEGAPAVAGDRDRIAQLFLNVLDNAVKHSPTGSTVHVHGERDDGAVVVRVRDEGGGLPAGGEARLFERFYRGANARRDGTGLGLAIAQAIARAHGGAISARDVDGGAEFAIRLPASSDSNS